MRALASIGIFTEEPDGSFALTTLADLLRSDAPGSLRAYAIMNGERWVWRSWGEIEFSVRTGQPAFEHVFGLPLFDYYASNPESGSVSAAALSSLSVAENSAIVAAREFPLTGTVVDVGGGEGSLLASILTAHPGIDGVLFERPAVIEAARLRLAAAGLADRCRLVSGDFFTVVPPAGDLYLMKKVIHDWDDEEAQTILARCRAAMPASARLLLAEQMILDDAQRSATKWLDLLMLVYAGGRERTAEEFGDLLTRSGFRMERVIPTTANVCVIEALAA